MRVSINYFRTTSAAWILFSEKWSSLYDSNSSSSLRKTQQLGFSRESQIRLYGAQFELVGDPLVVSDDVVFVDAVERKSGESCRVRIPLNIVKMATEQASSQTRAA